MSKCWFRHFNALVRKNFIIWKRTPGCSSFEVIAPLILMTLLALLRMGVPSTFVDQDAMLEKKFPSWYGVSPTGMGEWSHKKRDNTIVDDRVAALTCHSQYYDKKHTTDCSEYNLANDLHGPQYFTPSQCMKQDSW